MNDDISKVSAQDMTSADAESDESKSDNPASSRVFDITPDLNISPVKDEENQNAPTPIPSNLPQEKVNIPNIVDISEKNLGKVTVLPPSNQKDQSAPQLTELTIDKIVENQKPTGFTGQLQNNTVEPVPSFGPANPPAKTIGMNKISFNKEFVEPNKTEPSNLQDAVSSIKLSPDQKTPATIPPRPYEGKKDSKLRPLRTYETDFAEAMARKRITTTSAIIAEQKKEEVHKEVQVQNNIEKPLPNTLSSFAIPRSNSIADNMPIAKKPSNPLFSNPNNSDKPASSIENFLQSQNSNPARNLNPNPIPQNPVAKAPLSPNASFVAKNDYLKNAKAPESERKQDSHVFRNIILIIISLALIAGGAYAGYYLYKKSPLSLVQFTSPKPTTASNPNVIATNSIFPADKQTKISIDAKNKNQIITSIRNQIDKVGQENTIEEIIPTKNENNTIRKATASELQEILKIDAPSLITRSLTEDYMLGVYNGIGGQKNFFAITTNNFFQNTFAGMIEWEKNIPEDLKDFLFDNTTQFTLKGSYKDKIVRNKDVREYISENDHIIFLYSFLSNDKLIITNDEQALENIILRLEKNAFVR